VQVGHGLVDAWRHLHPEGPGVTHVATNGRSQNLVYKISTSCLVRPLRCPLQDVFLTSIEGVSRAQLCDREPSCVRVPLAPSTTHPPTLAAHCRLFYGSLGC